MSHSQKSGRQAKKNYQPKGKNKQPKGKMFMRLIGTALLCSNTPRGNIIVFVILVGKNIIVEGWCNMIL